MKQAEFAGNGSMRGFGVAREIINNILNMLILLTSPPTPFESCSVFACPLQALIMTIPPPPPLFLPVGSQLYTFGMHYRRNANVIVVCLQTA